MKVTEPEFIFFPPEFCPQAVVDWYWYRKNNNNNTQIKSSDVSTKAKNHLSALGWNFWYANKTQDKKELRYQSPSGKIFYSLRIACKACIDEQGQGSATTVSQNVASYASTCANTPPQLVLPKESCLFPGKIMGFDDNQENLTTAALSAKSLKPEEENDIIISESTSTPKPRFSKPKILRDSSSSSTDNRMKRKRPTTSNTNNSNKRVRKVVPNPNPKTILSSLIENNVVSVGARVHYRGKSCSGEIFPQGIKCHCCSKIFYLTAFETHAGSTNHRPAANILLDDGRSLVDCQKQMMNKNLVQTTPTRKNAIKAVVVGDEEEEDGNDDICAVCHYGGELVLCDRCPSAYHATCLGLKGRPPSGDWFCPPCRCVVCGGGIFDLGSLVCHQCERRYHSGCCERVFGSRESFSCSEKCQSVCLGLEKIIGKTIPVGENGLTWTLLKAASSKNDQSSKLGVALSVMHECFEPAKDPLTKRDIVEDVIFGRESELKRLNFRGFYVVVLEQNGEMISVALVRIFGDKLAEVPLVATRFRFRRMGMCGVLMKELEKQLGDLGVERLALPAAAGVLQTWTSSFGFSVMKDDEKLELLDYSLLDFQDTIMCHKLLNKTSMEKPRPLRRDLADDFLRECMSYDAAGSSSFITADEHNVENGFMNQMHLNTGDMSWFNKICS